MLLVPGLLLCLTLGTLQAAPLAEADTCVAVRPCDNAKNIGSLESKTDKLNEDLTSQLRDLTSSVTTQHEDLENLKTKYDQQQTSLDQLQDRLNLLTKEQDCLKRKLCEQDGFTFAGGLCYYISTEKKNLTDSRQWCRDRNSDLIVIKSKEKQDFVASFNKRVWLGLTDRETEGSFQWVDGTPLTTPTYWKSNEPNNYRDEEDCVEYEDPSRGWNDQQCSDSNYWMCERVVC